MATCLYDKCCFCVNLRVGSFIIGYLQLIEIAITTLMLIMLNNAGKSLAISINPDERTAGFMIVVGGIIALSIVAVLLTFTIVLLVGLHKRKPGHVKAYIVYCSIFLGLYTIGFIMYLPIVTYNTKAAFQAIFTILYNLYSVLVLRSYYRQMLDESAGPRQYNA